MMIIDYLGNHKEYIETVTEWLWKEFGNENSHDFFKSIVERSLVKDKLPITFVAIIDNELVGTVGLWRSDLVSRQDLYPWLSALYLKESHRKKGIGQELQRFLINYSKESGFKELFLYTDICDYYEKTGWQYIEDGVEFTGDILKIYKKSII